MTLLSACTPIVLVCAGALGGKLTSGSVTEPQEHVALLQVLPLFVPLLFGDCHVAHDPVCSAVDNAADVLASLHPDL